MQGLDGTDQTVLQGHINPITCVANSSDASIVVTAEAGEESVLIVWDTTVGATKLKVSKPHKHGVITMDMHSSSGVLVTLSDTGGEAVAQEISLWDISSTDKCKNLITVPIPAGDLQVWYRKPPVTRIFVPNSEFIEACCRLV
jgi:cilia- and flagella-associated protein 251